MPIVYIHVHNHAHTHLLASVSSYHLFAHVIIYTYSHGMARSNDLPKTIAGNYKYTTHTGRESLIYNSMNQSLYVPGKMTNSKVCFK